MYIVACAQLLHWGEISLQSLGSKATYASWVLSQHGDGDERLDSQQISTLEPQSLRQCVTMRRLVDSLGELMPEYTAWEK